MSYYGQEYDNQIAAGRIEPRAGSVYTTEQIFNGLALPDSPFLQIVWNKRTHNVQTAHMGHEATKKWLDAVAGDRKWRYTHTTKEWCPIFLYVDDRLPIDIVDAERYIVRTGESEDADTVNALWMTPVGFPRKQ